MHDPIGSEELLYYNEAPAKSCINFPQYRERLLKSPESPSITRREFDCFERRIESSGFLSRMPGYRDTESVADIIQRSAVDHVCTDFA
jgi:hypothetical protein